MNIRLNKDKFTAIDGAFLVLQENINSTAAIDIIKKSLEDCFKDCKFTINIINSVDNHDPFFVMSVFPEVSVIDKVIVAVMSNKETKAIKQLWETNKNWTIEIDSRILKNSPDSLKFSNTELTAMLLHEVGHIVCSTSIPNRISLILRYEMMNSKITNRMMLKDKIFRKILSLPILDSCISDYKRDKSSIKEEIKADAFAKKMGYTDELMSALTKLTKCKAYTNTTTLNEKMSKDTQFALNTLSDFQQRKDKLAKHNLLALKEECNSEYINSVIDTFLETVFEDPEESLSIFDGKKIKLMQERADKDIEDGYYTEFFLFKKELKRIDPAEIDYINAKIIAMKNENDRMMIISYIHSKIDLVEYYISILQNPKLSKKYDIPHTMIQLKALRMRLYDLRKAALKQKIPERNKDILVMWPKGYDG